MHHAAVETLATNILQYIQRSRAHVLFTASLMHAAAILNYKHACCAAGAGLGLNAAISASSTSTIVSS